MGHKFSLVLSRVVTDEESAILRDAGCACAVFTSDTLPTNAEVAVTRMDFDDTESPSLAEAIEAGLEAVKNVPELTVPGLTVPAVPKAQDSGTVIEGAVVDDSKVEASVVEASVVEEEPEPKKRSTSRKTTSKQTAKTADTVSAGAASE